MPLRVLYLHHYAVLGGASRSLMEMIESFTPAEVLPHVVAPRGQFAAILRRKGVPVLEAMGVSLFDHTRYSRYRGWRWLILIREILLLPFTISSIFAAKRAWPEIDLVHVNEATMLPSAILAKLVFRRPVIIHVRSVMQNGGSSWRDRLLRRVLWGVASGVVAIDESVRASLPADRPVRVVHNGLRVEPSKAVSPSQPASRSFTVGMVGTLLRVKGCFEFAEAAALCKQRGLPVKFVFVGQSARRATGLKHAVLRAFGIAQEIESELHERIDRAGLADTITFAGFSEDLSAVYRSMDVVCFPSHFDAPGRPIFEAALYGVPSIAAITRPLPDTIQSEVTGITIEPRNPRQLADAIERLWRDPQLRQRLGQNAREFAGSRFNARTNALRMLEIYRPLSGVGISSGGGLSAAS